MKLAVVGSTKLGESRLARAILEHILEKYRPSVVISGNAKGIDSLAASVARARGIEVVEYLPKVQRWYDGFKPRNIKIAENCDMLVRVALIGGKTYGSGWTRDYAEKLGKPTEEFSCGPVAFAEQRHSTT